MPSSASSGKCWATTRSLFGSDYPLRDPAAEIARIRGLRLGAEAEAAILGGNLQQLLHLEARAGD